MYVADVNRLTKVAAHQRQIIDSQEKMLELKDNIIEILMEQKGILIRTLSDIRIHSAQGQSHSDLSETDIQTETESEDTIQ